MGVKKRIKLCVLTFVFASVCLTAAQDVKVFIEPVSPTISKPAGQSFALTCIGEAENPDLFQNMRWTGPQGEIPDRETEDIYTSASGPNRLLLIFNNPTGDNTGLYNCSAMYDRTVTREHSVAIDFYHGITWEECPLQQAIVVNKEGRIRCRVNANPAATMSWVKNGMNLDTEKYNIQSDGVTIQLVTEEDGGTYTVRAMVSSTGDLRSRTLRVEVHVPPKINDFDEKYQFVEGERVELKCQATGYPAPRYYWTNQQQQNLSSVEGYLVNSDTGVLTIQKVIRDDAGTFKCSAVNSADVDYSEADVSVIVKPEVKEFQNETTIQGRDVQLKCRVSGDPKPRITIRKDGASRPFDNSEDRFQVESRMVDKDEMLILTIQSAMRSDDGLYYCAGENEGGHAERVGHLQIEFPPDMSLTSARTKKTWKEHPVNLSCIAEAIPNATITWTYKGQVVVSNELYHIYGDASSSNLLVKPSLGISGGTEVYGRYRCDARNQYGNNSVDIELTEAREPGKIQQYSVERNTATTITFMLRGPQDDGGLTIREFVVEYREKDMEQTAILSKEWIEGTSYILENLKPRTAYMFRFAAKNDAGIGRFSEDLEFVMPSESTPEIPNFMIPTGGNTSRFANSFLIRWGVPQDNGKKIELFSLRYFEIEFEGKEYRHIGNDQTFEITNWENAPRYNITHLKPNTQYKVELRAKNEIGFSQPASMVFKTNSGSSVEEQKIDDSGTNLTTAAMVAIIIVVVLVILGLLDATCYLRNQCGVFYCLRTAVCGRSPSSEKVKDGTIEDGGKGKGSEENNEKSKTEVDNPAFDSKDTKNNDHINEDAKNKSPKGSKSSVAKDSLV